MKVLTRDSFREYIFARDGGKCVICGKDAQDAHHIYERRLWDNGGYFLENGASLCGECHIAAEQTLISPEEVRKAAGISKRVLPEHLYEDYFYDKWGNIENSNGTRLKGELFFDESVQKILTLGGVLDRFQKYIKYPRTYHLPFSPGRTEDDKTLKDCSIFTGKRLVISTKMDGENTTGYWDGYIHARSLDSQNHESRSWVKNYLSAKLFDLPEGWRICGENLFAKHSIHYTELKSYFYLFSVWDEKNECLSWDDTLLWAALLDLTVVPYFHCDPNGMEQSIYSMVSGEEEGFVVRNADSFTYGSFRKNVAKYVRAEHVQSNQHWMKSKVIPNLMSS